MALPAATAWKKDDEVKQCPACNASFGIWKRKHHCRACGDVFCDACTQSQIQLKYDTGNRLSRVCMKCYTASKSTPPASTPQDKPKPEEEESSSSSEEEFDDDRKVRAYTRWKPEEEKI